MQYPDIPGPGDNVAQWLADVGQDIADATDEAVTLLHAERSTWAANFTRRVNDGTSATAANGWADAAALDARISRLRRDADVKVLEQARADVHALLAAGYYQLG